jgi:hypothetical protein
MVVLYNNAQRAEADICSSISPLLHEIGKQTSLREELATKQTRGTEQFLRQSISNPALTFYLRLCELDETCSLPGELGAVAEQEVCAGERIIAGTEQSIQIKLFIFSKV